MSLLKGVASEQLVEIRYKANSKILDNRGALAELFSSELNLPEWEIVENRFDVFKKDKSEMCFIGFKNCGMIMYDSPTDNYFIDRAKRFLEFISKKEVLDKAVFIERIGVRMKFIAPFERTFDDLLALYCERFVNFSSKAKERISADLVDIGLNLNFKDSVGQFNTASGPMEIEQMKQFIPRSKGLPQIGLYFDVDYWSKPNKKLSHSEVAIEVSTYDKACMKRFSQIRDLIYVS